MASLIVLYWRDIPAQVIAREGRQSEKRELPERFVQAIDRAAMAAGVRDSDAYLGEWRRSEPQPCGKDLAAVAEAAMNELTAAYTDARLENLVRSGGREPT